MLDARAQHLLKTLVERYIAEGQPVGSRALSRHSGLELSPATIRNVMADLEEMGFIASPHTSAGRVPTPRGYRFFVDSLMVMKPLDDSRDPPPRGRAQRRPPAADRQRRGVAAVAADAVRGRRRHAEAPRSGVSPPRVPAPLRAARAADHRHAGRRRAEPHPAYRSIVFADAADRGDEFLQPEFRRSIARIRYASASPTSCAPLRDDIAGLMKAAVDAGEGALAEGRGAGRHRRAEPVARGGPRVEHAAAAAAVRSVRAEDLALAPARRVAARAGRADLHRRRVGSRAARRMQRRHRAATRSNGQVIGTLGVIGPTRMAYERVIPIVDVTAKLLSNALSREFADD